MHLLPSYSGQESTCHISMYVKHPLHEGPDQRVCLRRVVMMMMTMMMMPMRLTQMRMALRKRTQKLSPLG